MSPHSWDGYETDELDALEHAVRGAFEPMPAEARARVASRLEAAVGIDRTPFLVRFARPLAALAVGATLLGGVSVAAAASDPGDVFYPVKRSVSALAVSIERPSSQPTLTPISRPAETPASAVHAYPAASAPARPGVKKLAIPAASKQSTASPKPGHKSSAGKSKQPPAKGKSGSSKAHPARQTANGHRK